MSNTLGDLPASLGRDGGAERSSKLMIMGRYLMSSRPRMVWFLVVVEARGIARFPEGLGAHLTFFLTLVHSPPPFPPLVIVIVIGCSPSVPWIAQKSESHGTLGTLGTLGKKTGLVVLSFSVSSACSVVHPSRFSGSRGLKGAVRASSITITRGKEGTAILGQITGTQVPMRATMREGSHLLLGALASRRPLSCSRPDAGGTPALPGGPGISI